MAFFSGLILSRHCIKHQLNPLLGAPTLASVTSLNLLQSLSSALFPGSISPHRPLMENVPRRTLSRWWHSGRADLCWESWNLASRHPLRLKPASSPPSVCLEQHAGHWSPPLSPQAHMSGLLRRLIKSWFTMQLTFVFPFALSVETLGPGSWLPLLDQRDLPCTPSGNIFKHIFTVNVYFKLNTFYSTNIFMYIISKREKQTQKWERRFEINILMMLILCIPWIRNGFLLLLNVLWILSVRAVCWNVPGYLLKCWWHLAAPLCKASNLGRLWFLFSCLAQYEKDCSKHVGPKQRKCRLTVPPKSWWLSFTFVWNCLFEMLLFSVQLMSSSPVLAFIWKFAGWFSHDGGNPQCVLCRCGFFTVFPRSLI